MFMILEETEQDLFDYDLDGIHPSWLLNSDIQPECEFLALARPFLGFHQLARHQQEKLETTALLTSIIITTTDPGQYSPLKKSSR